MAIKRIVVEVTLTVDAEGGTETFYFGTSGFRTKPTDAPANELVEGRLENAGTFKRELFSGGKLIGAVRPAFGEIVLDNADGGLDGWFDYAISGARVVVRWGDEGNAYPSGYSIVYIAYAHSFLADFDRVRIRLRDRMQMLDKPVVTATFDGSGGLEGTGVASKLKQLHIGTAGYFPPILIDEINQIYYLQESAVDDYLTLHVYEGGVELTQDSEYSSSAQLLSTAPASGRYRVWYGNDELSPADGPFPGSYPRGRGGPVFFRLGTPATKELRCIVAASTGNAGFYPNSFFAMLQRAGLESTEVAYTNGSILYLNGSLLDDGTTYLEALANEAIYEQMFFTVTRDDVFLCGRLSEPDAAANYFSQNLLDGTSAGGLVTRDTFTFTVDNSWNIRRTPVEGMEAPAYQVNYSFGKTWPCDCSSTAAADIRNYLSRDPWWATYSGKSDEALLANPGAIAMSFESPARSSSGSAFAQSVFLTRFFALFGGRRDSITLTTAMTDETLAIELTDNALVQINRFGCDLGRIFRVVTILIDAARREITFGLWGGDAGSGGGIDTGGGSTSSDYDPLAIQSEVPTSLTTESGLVLLIESTASYLLREDDSPVLTETRNPISLE